MKTHLALKHSENKNNNLYSKTLFCAGHESRLNADRESKFSCKDCGKTYTHKRSLWLHGKYECGKPPQFLCPFCPYKAKLKGNLKTHVLIKHPAAANAWDP
ncbi:longitudinals lacking protein, isoforms A/B/D/L-like [Homalodisca vitripennis]|uniref:longitudinals lacking protein, isoforms A/B/D/L-like n=1 Tax=Homalodisca vitripennis TaxID=197043 RepID=UPI001EEA84CA|nr:longitudinals lacking protein, isoforms A/B/D/L-like [Homalodisca vitripennis]